MTFRDKWKPLHFCSVLYYNFKNPVSCLFYANVCVQSLCQSSAGCQTRFSSGATSGKFNLKRVGSM